MLLISRLCRTPGALVALSSLILALSAGCGFLSGSDRVTIATATVTVTAENTSETSPSSSPPATTPPPDPDEPPALQDLSLVDPSEFTLSPGRWLFTSSSGEVVCRVIAGGNSFCHVTDDSGPPWDSDSICDMHHDQDPQGARSSLVGWEGNYRHSPCHTYLEGDWPRTGPALPSGKKLVMLADPDHGVTVTCGEQGKSLTCANNDAHGFTISQGAVRVW